MYVFTGVLLQICTSHVPVGPEIPRNIVFKASFAFSYSWFAVFRRFFLMSPTIKFTISKRVSSDPWSRRRYQRGSMEWIPAVQRPAPPLTSCIRHDGAVSEGSRIACQQWSLLNSHRQRNTTRQYENGPSYVRPPQRPSEYQFLCGCVRIAVQKEFQQLLEKCSCQPQPPQF